MEAYLLILYLAIDTRSTIIAMSAMVAPHDFVIGKPTPSSKTEPIQYSP